MIVIFLILILLNRFQTANGDHIKKYENSFFVLFGLGMANHWPLLMLLLPFFILWIYYLGGESISARTIFSAFLKDRWLTKISLFFLGLVPYFYYFINPIVSDYYFFYPIISFNDAWATFIRKDQMIKDVLPTWRVLDSFSFTITFLERTIAEFGLLGSGLGVFGALFSLVTSCTSSPTLPTGLGINNTTCAISGTPTTTTQEGTTYTLTASNSSGNTTANINITVYNAAPSELSYIGSPYTFTPNAVMTTQTPSYSGSVTSCTSSPTLPTGLGINNLTCVISGLPTATRGATGYTITTSNSSGSTTTTINITVNESSTWSQQAYLRAPNANAGDQFGFSVSVSGDIIVVGAFYEDSNQTTITNGSTASTDNSLSNSGAAYIFFR